MARVLEVGGRRLPFLRWSFIRMALGIKRLTTEWQVGDGREEALGAYVLATAPAGDLDAAISAIDRFGYEQSFLINVGDEKGGILDRAIATAQPALLLELGTYVGYSALRTVRAMPAGAHLVSIEFNPANAVIAQRVIDHAGVADRVTIVIGTIGDGGATTAALERDHGFAPGTLDFVFFDHDKDAYLPDLQAILERGWLHRGSRIVGDNIKFPGAPEFRAYLNERDGRDWRVTEHETHVEYQSLLKDLVIEAEFLGPKTASDGG
jgi:catechol O-methyltransferase